MDTLYTSILNFLNSFLPSAQQSTFGDINELLAYFLTVTLLWMILIRPILKAVKVIK